MENHGIPWNPVEIHEIPSDSLEFHGGGASAGRARSVPVGRPRWERSSGAAQGSESRRKFIKNAKIYKNGDIYKNRTEFYKNPGNL